MPKEQIVDLKDALLEINGVSLNDDENTTVTVMETSQNDWKFIIDYTEYKPGLIDLLDQTARRVEVKVNYHQDVCSLDFDTIVSSDHKKFKQVIDYLVSTNDDIRLDFSEISLKTLSCEKRIQLFNEFFQYNHLPWEFVEIKKLKVKRDDNGDKSNDNTELNERIIEDDQLQGINSALIDGKNLIENKFVKGTLDNGFYFSMAQMRFDNTENSDFIDVAIEFLSRPEKCETKMVSSGYYFYDNELGRNIEETSVIESKKQDPILFEFKNVLFEIHRRLLADQNTSFSAGEIEVKFLEEEVTSEITEGSALIDEVSAIESITAGKEIAAAVDEVAVEEVATQSFEEEVIDPDEAQN